MLYILEGEATITINEVDYPAKPGDAFICSPGDVHNVWNKTKEDFRLVVFKINLPEEGKTVTGRSRIYLKNCSRHCEEDVLPDEAISLTINMKQIFCEIASLRSQ